MTPARKLAFIALLFVTCIGCDQTTKHLARSTLQCAVPRSFFNNIVELRYAENPGGMMSFGAELPAAARFWFLTVFVGVLLSGLLLFTLFNRTLTTWQTTALTLIVAGGYSNLIDRINHNGHVIDFLTIGIGSVRTAIFNFADVVILLGTLLLLLATPFKRQARSPEPSAHAQHPSNDVEG